MEAMEAGSGEITRPEPRVTSLQTVARPLCLAVAWSIFIAIAYLCNLAPKRSVDLTGLTIFWAFFSLTEIILCDQVTIALGRESLLQHATRDRCSWTRLLCVGAVSGLLLDGLAQWLGKLWIYPYWNEAFYGSTFIIGFAAYWLAISESYVFVRAILNWIHRERPVRHTPRIHQAALFRAFGVAGIALTATAILRMWKEYRMAGGYVFEIRQRVPVHIHFAYFLMAFIGVWLTLEWIQVARGKLSLLKTIMNGRLMPLLALLISSSVFSIFWETVNAAHHFWVYTNWPLPQWQLAHVPITVLLTWPLQYVVFLSLSFLLGLDLWM